MVTYYFIPNKALSAISKKKSMVKFDAANNSGIDNVWPSSFLERGSNDFYPNLLQFI